MDKLFYLSDGFFSVEQYNNATLHNRTRHTTVDPGVHQFYKTYNIVVYSYGCGH